MKTVKNFKSYIECLIYKSMKTEKIYNTNKLWAVVRQFSFGVILLFATSAYSQTVNSNENNQTPIKGVQYVYEEKPSAAVYVTSESSKAMPAALLTDNMADLNDVTVWDNSSEGNLLVMAVKTIRKDLSAIVYDENGKRVLNETPIDPGTYRIVEHTHDLKPGVYNLSILERGIVIQKQKFTVK